MRRLWLLLLLIVSLFVLPGCWDQRVVEQMEFILNAGFDVGPDNQIIVYFSTPSITGGGSSGSGGGGGGAPKPNLYSTVANTPREARERLRLGSFGRLEAGKVQQIMFGEELAKKGIVEYTEIFSRDPRDPVLARPIIIKGKAGDMMKASLKWETKGLPGLYLRRLLDNMAAEGNVPDHSVSHFLTNYFAPGIDPTLPYLSYTPTGALTLGTALFHGDRFTGHLNTDETYLLLVLTGHSPKHISAFFLKHHSNEPKRKVLIRFLKAQSKSKIALSGGTPQIHFKIKMVALLDEWHIDELLQSQNIHHVQAVVAWHIRHDLDGVWQKLTKANCDALGIGDQIRAYHNGYWRSHKWDQVYPKIKASFDVKVEIQRFGVLQ